MKKKLFGTILAAALIVSQAVTAFAAGESKEGGMSLVGDSAGKYELVEATADSLPELAASAPEVMAKIEAVNSGAETLQSVADLAPELEDDLAGKVMLTKFFDLIPINGGVQTEDGKYRVNLSVPALSGNVSEVGLLHYSTSRNVWEIVEPEAVDYTNKEVTVIFEDLSPVAVIGKVSGGADASVGTSPKTGTTYSWAAWLGAAVVLGVTGTAVYRKTRR